MPSLLMDVDSVQAAQSRMLQEIESMRAELTSLSSQVNQVVGSAWVGNAASDFQGTYETLRTQITQQLETLDELAQTLQGEINQWQETAARMG